MKKKSKGERLGWLPISEIKLVLHEKDVSWVKGRVLSEEELKKRRESSSSDNVGFIVP